MHSHDRNSASEGGRGLRSASYRNFPQHNCNFSMVGALTRHSATVLCRRVQAPGWGPGLRLGAYTKGAWLLDCRARDLCGRTLFCFPKCHQVMAKAILTRMTCCTREMTWGGGSDPTNGLNHQRTECHTGEEKKDDTSPAYSSASEHPPLGTPPPTPDANLYRPPPPPPPNTNN